MILYERKPYTMTDIDNPVKTIGNSGWHEAWLLPMVNDETMWKGIDESNV